MVELNGSIHKQFYERSFTSVFRLEAKYWHYKYINETNEYHEKFLIRKTKKNQ